MEENNILPRAVVLITNQKLASRAEKLMRENSRSVHYKLSGQGTASSEMMDILGLGSVDKGVIISFLPKEAADTLLKKLHKTLKLGSVNSGIAFTVPLTGANNVLLKLFDKLDEGAQIAERKKSMEENGIKYTMIAAIINRGYSEEVMNAARAAGAGGGTVLHSRRVGSEQALNFLGISVQEEREIVMIVASAESKLDIMKAIGEKCGMKSEAKGIVLSLPIDSVIGLEQYE